MLCHEQGEPTPAATRFDHAITGLAVAACGKRGATWPPVPVQASCPGREKYAQVYCITSALSSHNLIESRCQCRNGGRCYLSGLVVRVL